MLVGELAIVRAISSESIRLPDLAWPWIFYLTDAVSLPFGWSDHLVDDHPGAEGGGAD